jgi:hypothetical protein
MYTIYWLLKKITVAVLARSLNYEKDYANITD